MVIGDAFGLRLVSAATATGSVGCHRHAGDYCRVLIEFRLDAVDTAVKFAVLTKLLPEPSEYGLHKSLWIPCSIRCCSSFTMDVLPSISAGALSSFAVASARERSQCRWAVAHEARRFEHWNTASVPELDLLPVLTLIRPCSANTMVVEELLHDGQSP